MLKTSKVKGMIIAIVVGTLAGASTCWAGKNKEVDPSKEKTKELCALINDLIPIFKLETEKRQKKVDEEKQPENKVKYEERIKFNNAKISILDQAFLLMCVKKKKGEENKKEEMEKEGEED